MVKTTYTNEDIVNLIEFAKYILNHYEIGINWGSMFSSEYFRCDPSPEYLVERFLKGDEYEKGLSEEDKKRIIKSAGELGLTFTKKREKLIVDMLNSEYNTNYRDEDGVGKENESISDIGRRLGEDIARKKNEMIADMLNSEHNTIYKDKKDSST